MVNENASVYQRRVDSVRCIRYIACTQFVELYGIGTRHAVTCIVKASSSLHVFQAERVM